jgi:membrane peptidoglycan carboxypeptidase
VYTDLSRIDEFVLPYAVSTSQLNTFESIVLALEDRRFPTHCGIDLRSVLREAWHLVTFRKFGGASTIEMQFVRTCTGYKRRRIGRKLYEMLLAHLVSTRHPKKAILRSYLSIVYLGSGLSGANYTSLQLFGRETDDLNLSEASEIAAMMVYPRPRVPTESWRRKIERRGSYGAQLIQRLSFSIPDEQ